MNFDEIRRYFNDLSTEIYIQNLKLIIIYRKFN